MIQNVKSQHEHGISNCLFGQWIVIAAATQFTQHTRVNTKLDQHMLVISKTDKNYQAMFPALDLGATPLTLQERYGLIWLCLGLPHKPLFNLVEYDHPQARIVSCGAYGVHTSPLRAVENFLDMAHFPYVHNKILGAEPLTEVPSYQVNINQDDEIWATDCCFSQPLAAPNSTQPQVTHYKYRVVSPLNVILYKVNTEGTGAIPADVICLFIQPISEIQIRAHLLMILDDQNSSMTDMILFQQKIFSQDKPILENHHPLKLPLTGRLEIPTRADLTATYYRQWLKQKQWHYGALWDTEVSV